MPGIPGKLFIHNIVIEKLLMFKMFIIGNPGQPGIPGIKGDAGSEGWF